MIYRYSSCRNYYAIANTIFSVINGAVTRTFATTKKNSIYLQSLIHSNGLNISGMTTKETFPDHILLTTDTFIQSFVLSESMRYYVIAGSSFV